MSTNKKEPRVKNYDLFLESQSFLLAQVKNVGFFLNEGLNVICPTNIYKALSNVTNQKSLTPL